MSRLILLGKQSQGEKSHSVSYFELQQTLRQLECYAEMYVREYEVPYDSNTGVSCKMLTSYCSSVFRNWQKNTPLF
jgi:hypothetical protein